VKQEGAHKSKKVGFVDGVRGLGALVVVFHHFSWAFLPAMVGGDFALAHLRVEKLVYDSPLYLMIAGGFAVCMFFVLSGFALSYKFFQTQRHEEVTSGAVRRYFRLAPVVVTAVMLSCGLLALGLYFNNQAYVASASPWLKASWQGSASFIDALKFGLYGVFFGNSHGAEVSRYDNVLWTMQVEFFGSFMVFAFLAIFGRQPRRWIAYIVALFLLRNTYYLGFAFGVALCDWYVMMQQRERLPESKILGYPLLIGGLATGCLALAQPRIWLLGAAGALAGVVLLPSAQRLLGRRPVRYLGRVSFSLYVVHLLILASLGCWLFVHLQRHLTYGVAVAATGLVCLPLIFLAAEGLTRWVDAPAIKYSGVLYRRWFAGKRTADETFMPAPALTPTLEAVPVPVALEMPIRASDMMIGDE